MRILGGTLSCIVRPCPALGHRKRRGTGAPEKALEGALPASSGGQWWQSALSVKIVFVCLSLSVRLFNSEFIKRQHGYGNNYIKSNRAKILQIFCIFVAGISFPCLDISSAGLFEFKILPAQTFPQISTHLLSYNCRNSARVSLTLKPLITDIIIYIS